MGLNIDYSLYLVTGRNLLPPGKALQGGVTLVQVREKSADTGEILEVAQKTQAVCKKYNVPVLIDDRIDIALAMGADGVHLGQTDMPIPIARKLLPPGTIVGKTCNTVEQVRVAVEEGADYVGIGPVWGTQTKKLTHPVAGPKGMAELLQPLEGTNVKAVAIAGINSENVLNCLWGSVTPSGHALDGVAVVSDIVASTEPKIAAQRLAAKIRAFYDLPFRTFSEAHTSLTTDGIKNSVGRILTSIRKFGPLVHQITNTVVTTQSANATLALGASPIMSTAPEEMADLGKVGGGLLVNFGTIQNIDGRQANINRKPIVFDPVGVGASKFRKESAAKLLNTWHATVIKGNAGELAALANSQEVQAKGVDSVGTGFANPGKFVRDLARERRCIVVLTGVTDWVSDGNVVVKLSNGHPLLGEITGSGCMVGTCVATFCGAVSMAEAAARPADAAEDGKLARGDMLLASVGGVLALTVASEIAAKRSDVHGSGTFLPALIDELGKLTPEKIAETANIEIIS
ncbi:hypothetical protein EIP86_004925 [Pleurotus ostreatoroseus]|nr:hypothetical protein EIP86_004925 [Pleurotus ostreatoroseus]